MADPICMRFVVPGDPVPQGRGRAVPTARGIRIKDPDRARNWKRGAAAIFRLAMRHRPPISGPLVVEILIVSRCTKAARKRCAPRQWDTRATGDADNYAKAVLDAANEAIFEDDRQVVDLRVRKVIGAHDEDPRVEMTVWEEAA